MQTKLNRLTRIILYFIIAFVPFLSFAQKRTELPSSYYLYRTNPRTKPYLIKNEDVQLYANQDSIKQFSEEVQKKFYEKLAESEIVILNAGRYHFKNKYEDFTFSINENGLINGEANYFRFKNTAYQSTFTFVNGVLVKTKTINTIKNEIFSQSELKDEVLTEESFYPSGKLKEQRIEDFRITDYQKNTIRTVYFEDGPINDYNNTIDGIFKVYNSSGTLKRHADNKQGFDKLYNKDETLDMIFYNKGDESRTEYYVKGVINKKQTENKEESREYFYENGKMLYYEVYNLKTKERKVFDSKNKLMPGKTIPRISM